MSSEPVLRVATAADPGPIDDLMKASIRDIFPVSYNAGQTASWEQFIGSVDRMLIEDGTYFVFDVDGELVPCGGWSRRDKLYTGSGDAAGDARCSTSRPSPPVSARCSRGAIGLGESMQIAPGSVERLAQRARCQPDVIISSRIAGNESTARLRWPCSE
jgi:hypothetical protein